MPILYFYFGFSQANWKFVNSLFQCISCLLRHGEKSYIINLDHWPVMEILGFFSVRPSRVFSLSVNLKGISQETLERVCLNLITLYPRCTLWGTTELPLQTSKSSSCSDNSVYLIEWPFPPVSFRIILIANAMHPLLFSLASYSATIYEFLNFLGTSLSFDAPLLVNISSIHHNLDTTMPIWLVQNEIDAFPAYDGFTSS